ncbi:MAG: DUF305 domain-containing protein [Candidatus Nanopelagicales bacterium]
MLRRTTLIVGAAALGVILAGCGGSHDMADMATPSSTSGASAADAMFAQMMIPHHEQAVEMSTLAETRASSPQIKELAAEIKGAQQPEVDQMTSWLEEWGLPVLSMDEAMGDHGGHGMSGMLTDEQMQLLADANGPEFDRLFAEFMIEHHEGAIDMAEDVVDSKDPRVAALAAEIIATQAEEIAQLRAFLDGSATPAKGDASGSPSVVQLSTPVDHVHAAVYVDGALLIGTHTGVVSIDPGTGMVSRVGDSRDDFMGLAGTGGLLVASGHPGAGSTLPDPVGLIRSADGGQSWQTVSLTSEIDFHALAIDGDRVAGSATAGELLYSEDAGRTWLTIVPGEATALAWFDGRLWIAGASGVSTWAPGDDAPLAAGLAGLLVASDAAGTRLWVLRPDGTLATSVNGTTWMEAGAVPEAASMAASAQAVYVATPDKVYVVPAP